MGLSHSYSERKLIFAFFYLFLSFEAVAKGPRAPASRTGSGTARRANSWKRERQCHYSNCCSAVTVTSQATIRAVRGATSQTNAISFEVSMRAKRGEFAIPQAFYQLAGTF